MKIFSISPIFKKITLGNKSNIRFSIFGKMFYVFLCHNKYFYVILISLLAFLARVYLFRYRLMPEGDGCHYVAFAKDFLHGNFSTIGTGHYKAMVALISIFGFIFKDLEFTGRLISAISGSLLILASFIFAEKIFNRRIAYYASFLIMVNLNLLLYSTLIWTESLYALSIMLVALIGWISMERKKPGIVFLLGAAIGFSFTVRNEALIFAPIFMLLIIAYDYKKALKNILFFSLGIALFILPILIFHYWQYSHWTLGDKGIINFLYGDAGIAYRMVNERMADFTTNKYCSEAYERFNSHPLNYLIENIFFVNRLLINLKKSLSCLLNQFLFIPFLGKYISIFFLIYGSYICLKNKAMRARYFYILLFPLTAYFVVSLCFMEERKVVPFIAFFLFIICVGVYHLEKAIISKKIRYVYYLFLAVIFLTSSFIAFNKAKINPIGDAHILMKETGLWMRNYLSQKEKIVVAEPFIPYYFYKETPNNYAPLIYANYETLIKYAKSCKAGYLVIPSWLVDDNPACKYLFENKNTSDLNLLNSIKKDNIEILIYQIK